MKVREKLASSVAYDFARFSIKLSFSIEQHRSKPTSLHVHHAFLYISLPLLHDYDVKMPNFTFYVGHKQATKKYFFSF